MSNVLPITKSISKLDEVDSYLLTLLVSDDLELLPHRPRLEVMSTTVKFMLNNLRLIEHRLLTS